MQPDQLVKRFVDETIAAADSIELDALYQWATNPTECYSVWKKRQIDAIEENYPVIENNLRLRYSLESSVSQSYIQKLRYTVNSLFSIPERENEAFISSMASTYWEQQCMDTVKHEIEALENNPLLNAAWDNYYQAPTVIANFCRILAWYFHYIIGRQNERISGVDLKEHWQKIGALYKAVHAGSPPDELSLVKTGLANRLLWISSNDIPRTYQLLIPGYLLPLFVDLAQEEYDENKLAIQSYLASLLDKRNYDLLRLLDEVITHGGIFECRSIPKSIKVTPGITGRLGNAVAVSPGALHLLRIQLTSIKSDLVREIREKITRVANRIEHDWNTPVQFIARNDEWVFAGKDGLTFHIFLRPWIMENNRDELSRSGCKSLVFIYSQSARSIRELLGTFDEKCVVSYQRKGRFVPKSNYEHKRDDTVTSIVKMMNEMGPGRLEKPAGVPVNSGTSIKKGAEAPSFQASGRRSVTSHPRPGINQEPSVQPAAEMEAVAGENAAVAVSVQGALKAGFGESVGEPAGTQQPEPEGSKLSVQPGTRHSTSDRLRFSLGCTRENNTVYWEPDGSDTKAQLVNGNILITGGAGSGKTESLKSILYELHKRGFPCLVIAFHPDLQVLQEVGFQYFNFSMLGNIGINPLDFDSLDEQGGGFPLQVYKVLDRFKEAYRTLGDMQQAALKDVLDEAYQRKGITDDPATWTQQCPDFDDVEAILDEKCTSDDDKEMRNYLRKLKQKLSKVFDFNVFSKRVVLDTKDLKKISSVIDLSDLEGELQFIVADTIIRKVYGDLRTGASIKYGATGGDRFRLFIAVDEAKILVPNQADDKNAIMNILGTEARKFGVGFIVSSQITEHFGIDVLANMATKIALKPLQEGIAKDNARELNIDYRELMKIKKPGEGFVRFSSADKPEKLQFESYRTRMNRAGKQGM